MTGAYASESQGCMLFLDREVDRVKPGARTKPSWEVLNTKRGLKKNGKPRRKKRVYI